MIKEVNFILIRGLNEMKVEIRQSNLLVSE